MPENKSIYIAFPLASAEQSLIQQVLLPAEHCHWAQHLSEEEQLKAFLEAEVVFGNVPPDWLAKSRKLRWLQLYSAGVNPYQQLDWRRFPEVTVTNLRKFFGQPVAETAVAGILAFYRKIDVLVRLQAKHTWIGAKLRPQMQLLYKKNALILGGGAIGLSLQTILTGFNCTTQVISRSGKVTLDHLDELLPEADLLISCLPETTQTQGVVTKHRLSLMKKTAVFVNVGRGSAIDEPALMEALLAGRLGGAVLDVSAQEPLPEDHPLWTCPNVLLTQHTGGGFEAEDRDKVQVFIQNFRRYREGEPLLNVVDFNRGY